MATLQFLKETLGGSTKLVRNAIFVVGAALGSLASFACDYNPYGGKTLEEVVEIVDEPIEAQDFIYHNIPYAYQDAYEYAETETLFGSVEMSTSPRKERALNGAERQSFRTTFDRGIGVCRDGAIAVAAMLQDDGYPAKVLDVSWTGGNWSAHSVYVWQNNGKWGSAGINMSDYRDPTFNSIEELAREIAQQYDGSYLDHTLYDFSCVDLIEGTNEGMVRVEPFIEIRISHGNTVLTGSAEKTTTGYESEHFRIGAQLTETRHLAYTQDAYDDHRVISQEYFWGNVLSEWWVENRTPFRLPSETRGTSIVNGDIDNIKHSQSWISYNDLHQESREELEITKQGILHHYQLSTWERHPNGQASIHIVKTSYDGDYEFDIICRSEFEEGGGLIVRYWDHDADGTWDEIEHYP